MFFGLLCRHEAVTVCYSPQEFWERWSVVIGQTNGLLLSNNPLFLADGEGLERWIFSAVGLAYPRERGFEFVPFGDDQSQERWAVVLTRAWQLVLVSRESLALFSFAPRPIQSVLDILLDAAGGTRLGQRLQSFPLQLPDYKVMANLMGGLFAVGQPVEVVIPDLTDIDVLQSMIHEVRTPLTAIRTLVHSVLRRSDLSPIVRQRIEQIDREATEQIDRLNLIFQVVEHSEPIFTESFYLQELLASLLPQWQWQTARRNLVLEYVPSDLPPVVSNRELLQQLLKGLIDRLFRLLPPGNKIELSVHPAGSFVKLEIVTSREDTHPLRPIGRLLLLQPETGVISLSLVVTKALFQSLGGKFILKTIPKGEILTVFLPALPG